jgi:hypothetical protein
MALWLCHENINHWLTFFKQIYFFKILVVRWLLCFVWHFSDCTARGCCLYRWSAPGLEALPASSPPWPPFGVNLGWIQRLDPVLFFQTGKSLGRIQRLDPTVHCTLCTEGKHLGLIHWGSLLPSLASVGGQFGMDPEIGSCSILPDR